MLLRPWPLSFSPMLVKHLSLLPLTKEPDSPSQVNDARAFEGKMSLVFPLCLDKDSTALLLNTNRAAQGAGWAHNPETWKPTHSL